MNRVFFKVLSSWSFFFKGKRLWVLKSNMVDKMSYHSYFPASKICQKDSPHQNVFKLTFSQRSFYVFRKDRQCKFIFLLSPSLDLINIISVRALEVMKVASETLQRSWRTTLAAGTYLQPWMKEILEQSVILFNPFMFVFILSRSILYIMNEELPPCVSLKLGYFAFAGKKLQSLCDWRWCHGWQFDVCCHGCW